MDKEDFGTLIIVGAVIFGALCIMIGGIYLFDKNVGCPKFARSVQLEYNYDFFAGGCFVKYDGQWIPSGNLRGGKFD